MTEFAVGLMSGTSLDGVDAALVEITDTTTVRLVAFHTRPYTEEERAMIAAVIGGAPVREVTLLHRRLGEWFAAAALEVLDRAGLSPQALVCIASHGQTVWHAPGRATLQLGCPATIAERVGVRVVSDFRSRDIAAGGQGAPLVPLADAMLFGAADHPRALLNLGGMANVTWVPRRGSIEGVVAGDTGPGVAVIDAVARAIDPSQPYDVDGRRAAAGRPVEEVLTDLLADPFFAAPPPKSTGRETFGEVYAHRLVQGVRRHEPGATNDCVATAVELTVKSVARHIERWLPRSSERADLLVSGGGARNPALLAGLRRALPGWPLRMFDDEFFDGDAKEAVAFAYLGWRTVHGLPGNVPGATGAKGPRVLGSVTEG